MVVSELNNYKQVEHVGLENRFIRKTLQTMVDNVAFFDISQLPTWYFGQRCVDKIDQRLDLLFVEFATKTLHLGCSTPFGNHLNCFLLAQPLQVLGQQRGSHQAKTAITMTGSTVLFVKGRYLYVALFRTNCKGD